VRDDETYRRIQSLARSHAARTGTPVATQGYLIRHSLESFLDRLSQTRHARGFVLKGGILLGAYGVRRPTKDADSNALSADVAPEHLRQVMSDIAQVPAMDGVEFRVEKLEIIEIREGADYPGMRLRVPVLIGSWRGVVVWDVSTGDPVVPAPREVTLDRLIGEPIRLIGYAAESTVAEKGVTILERGVTSTRWRDYVDIVALGEAGLDRDALLRASRAVADYRGVRLQPIAPLLEGYGAIGQAKWAAWRRREGLGEVCEVELEDQIARVAAVLDPVFGAPR